MPATLAANFVTTARGSRPSSPGRSNPSAASTDHTTFEATLKGLRGQGEVADPAASTNDAAPATPARAEVARKKDATPTAKPDGARRQKQTGRDEQAAQSTGQSPVDGPAVGADENEQPAVAMIPVEADVSEEAMLDAEADANSVEQAEEADPEVVNADQIAAGFVPVADTLADTADDVATIDESPEDETAEPKPVGHLPTASRALATPVDDGGDETEDAEFTEEAEPSGDGPSPGIALDLSDEEAETSALPDAARLATTAAAANQPARPVASSIRKDHQAEATATADAAGEGEGSLFEHAAEQAADQGAAEGDADAQAFASKEQGTGAATKTPLPVEQRTFDQAMQQAAGEEQAQAGDVAKQTGNAALTDKPARPPLSERAFVQANHDRIVTNVRTQLMPNGGSMQIRLNPDNLGAMNISVRVVDGVLSAAFQTSSDEATRLVSHTLGQLKTALESQGVAVDRIHVQQAPREAQASRDDGQQPRDNSEQRQQQQESFRQQQERRHILNRMWQRLADGGDPLDLVA